MTRLIDPWAEPRYKWPPHAVIWLKSAKCLPFYDRMAAYREIAQLLEIDLSQVHNKAKKLRRVNRAYRVSAE